MAILPESAPFPEVSGVDEDAIFKSLTHEIRRKAIRLFAPSKSFTFSEIKKQMDPIDSPSLAYHLKSLQALIPQEDGKYRLSGIGTAALALLMKVDEGDHARKVERNFLYVSILSSISWNIVINIIPWAWALFFPPTDWGAYIFVVTLLAALSIPNMIIVGELGRRSRPRKMKVPKTDRRR